MSKNNDNRPLPESTYEKEEGPRCPFCGTQWTADDPMYFDESGFDDECPTCLSDIRIVPQTSVAWTVKPIRWAETKASA